MPRKTVAKSVKAAPKKPAASTPRRAAASGHPARKAAPQVHLHFHGAKKMRVRIVEGVGASGKSSNDDVHIYVDPIPPSGGNSGGGPNFADAVHVYVEPIPPKSGNSGGGSN